MEKHWSTANPSCVQHWRWQSQVNYNLIFVTVAVRLYLFYFWRFWSESGPNSFFDLINPQFDINNIFLVQKLSKLWLFWMGWCLRSDQIVIHLRLSALLIYNSCANSIYIRTQNLGAAYRNLELGFLPLLKVKWFAKLRQVICHFLYYGAAIPSQKVI